MATIEINEGNLVVQMHGWDVVLALRSTLTVPLAHIRDVVVTPPDAQFDNMKGLRLAGGYFPKAFATGYFWVTGVADQVDRQHALAKLESALADLKADKDELSYRANDVRTHIETAANGIREALKSSGASPLAKYLAFYDVHHPDKTIGIDVEHGRLRRVVIEIEGETPEEAMKKIKTAMAK